jgi:plastocyanin
MNRRLALIATLSIGLAAPAFAYEGGAVADGGSITGTVKFDGTAPAPKKLDITKDKEVCGKEEHFDEALVVGADNGIKNAVVAITNITKGKAIDTATGTVLDQKGCQYRPRVTLTPVNATVKVLNPDGILHNIHTFSKKNPPINRAQPKFKKEIEEKFAQPETFAVRCDAHAWMSGWIVVQEHPYYAVTDESGTFSLTDVPAGDYEVKVWHETLGEQTQKVSVPVKGEAKAEFKLAAK